MRFISDEPALLIDELEKNTLVISDLHLGIEYDIYKKGIKIPPRVEKQKSRILKLIGETDAERVILLGDIKHNVPKMSISEKENLPDLFRALDEKTELIIAKGNHDGNIEELTGDVKVSPGHGFKLDDFYFNHGHAWPGEQILESKVLIRGHSHPAIRFEDKLGFSSTVSSWIKGEVNCDMLKEKLEGDDCKLEKFVMVPSFNDMIDGTPVNNNSEDIDLGPLLENGIIDISESDAYLLDGTFLGKIKNI